MHSYYFLPFTDEKKLVLAEYIYVICHIYGISHIYGIYQRKWQKLMGSQWINSCTFYRYPASNMVAYYPGMTLNCYVSVK